jgi:transposase InsO family protein
MQCRRAQLDAAIAAVFDANDGEYGSPRIHAELIEDPRWRHLSVNSVADRMKALNLRAKPKLLRRSLTKPDPTAPKFANLLKRHFEVPAMNVAWVGDITEIVTWEGKLYLATVLELYSRRLLGWAIEEHCKAGLVVDALRMAAVVRGDIRHVKFHTDRGTQYTSHAFTALCRRLGVIQSMSRSGSCLDNAVAESFFATLKTEKIYRNPMRTKAEARQHITEWIHRYNHTRRHSHNNMLSPITYENTYHITMLESAA